MRSRTAHLIGAVAAAATLVGSGDETFAASDLIEIQWEQLIPQDRGGQDALDRVVPRGVVPHGGTTPLPDDFGGLVHDYDGERVRLAGYVLPLDFAGTSIQEFLLVPYIGACIHVPPPPPNQIVYVTIEQGIEVDGMFEAVWVTGTFDTASISNELADVGYRMEAESVEPYEQ
jgi:uncharacterized protein